MGTFGTCGTYGDLWQCWLPHGNTFPPPKSPWGALGTRPVSPQGPNKHEDRSPQPQDRMGTAGSGWMGTMEAEWGGTQFPRGCQAAYFGGNVNTWPGAKRNKLLGFRPKLPCSGCQRPSFRHSPGYPQIPSPPFGE